ncbi:uncharacterized protein PFLUO_LOCUS7466 [Penicillium psychrofluorescens]|uniref:uncharacterized protein n=1 Tax=Penicillium psychrofluorescens TaxID=3158075 RepID=UPI003CCCE57D
MPSSTSAGGASPTPDALESDLLTKLAATSALEDLQETLLGSLHRLGWTDKVTTLATELLRAGRCETFDDVMEAVVASAEGRSHPALDSESSSHKPNGDSKQNGSKGNTTNGTAVTNTQFDSDKYFEGVDVRIPETVVGEGVRGLKDILRDMVDLEGESTTNGDKK